MTTRYDAAAIRERIPHRFENELIDWAETRDDGGVFGVHISENDPFNRTLFFKTGVFNTPTIGSPFLMEMLALGALVFSTIDSETQLGVYAGIQNFKQFSPFELGKKYTGNVISKGSRGRLLKSFGQILDESGEPIAEGSMTAFIIDKKDFFAALPTPDDASSASSTPLFTLPKESTYKSSEMVVVDHLLEDNGNEASFDYTYPADHPLVKGHFPNFPLMMGVMSWGTIEDACSALAFHRGNVPKQVRGNARLSLASGQVSCEITGFEVSCVAAEDGSSIASTITKTDKVLFKEKVAPGQKLSIHLYDLEWVE